MRKIQSIIMLCSLFMITIIGSVSASWLYAENGADTKDDNTSVILTEWYYPENLPGGGDNAEEEFNDGISHAGIIQDIIDDVALYSPSNNESV